MGRFLDIALPYADDQMSMDVEHALMIGQFIREAGINTVVEVGCCYGVSTGAILDAFDGEQPDAMRMPRLLHLIDPRFTTPIERMCSSLWSEPVSDFVLRRTEQTSLASHVSGVPPLSVYFGELVVLDGDHSVETVTREVETILDWDTTPYAVAFHDSGRAGMDGPRAGVDILQGHGFCAVMNDDPSIGKRTARGLTICTWGSDKIHLARKILGVA